MSIMNSMILNRLLDDDEKFWSIVKDKDKRAAHLTELYRRQAVEVLILVVEFIVTLAGIALRSSLTITMGLFFLLLIGFWYINTTSKIRMIKLYEILSTTEKKL